MSIRRKFYKLIPDYIFLKLLYYKLIGKRLNLRFPQLFNEKLQWLKLYDRNPLYTTLVDKYAVREYIKEKIGEEYLVPLVGDPWKTVEEIPFESLPNKFVLKVTHDSGGVIICKNKKDLNIEVAKQKLQERLNRNFYYIGREWPYKYVQPQIIAEEYIEMGDGKELIDYKFMCFNGNVKSICVCEDRYAKDGLKITFYDRDWEIMPFERVTHPKNEVKIEKPINFEKMMNFAEELASNIPFLRVDFYDVCGKIYFGELTFYPASGFEEFRPLEWNRILGDWLVLPQKI